jgi:hypothetical protein
MSWLGAVRQRVFRPVRWHVVKGLSITREPPNEPLTPGLRPKDSNGYHEEFGFWAPREFEDDE